MTKTPESKPVRIPGALFLRLADIRKKLPNYYNAIGAPELQATAPTNDVETIEIAVLHYQGYLVDRMKELSQRR